MRDKLGFGERVLGVFYKRLMLNNFIPIYDDFFVEKRGQNNTVFSLKTPIR